MISAAVLTSIPFLTAALFVAGVLKGWVKLGSALFGAACGVIIGGILVRDKLTTWVTDGVAWGGTLLQGWLAGIDVHGVRPLEAVPAGGWQIIFLSLVVVLGVSPLVVALDGGRRKKATARSE